MAHFNNQKNGQDNTDNAIKDAIQYFIDSLSHMIERKVTDIVSKKLTEYEKYRDVKIVSTDEDGCINGAYADVKIVGVNGVFSVINKTGETLNKGDTARIYISGNNFSDSYIGIKR